MKISRPSRNGAAYFIRKPRAGCPGRYNGGGNHGTPDAISLVENGLRRSALGAAPRARAAALRLREGEALGRRGRSVDRRRRSGVARGAENGKIPRHLHRGEKREGRDRARARPGRASRLRSDRRAARAAGGRGLHDALERRVRAFEAGEISGVRRVRRERLRRRAPGRAETRGAAQARSRLEPDHDVRDRPLFREARKRARGADPAAARGREEMKAAKLIGRARLLLTGASGHRVGWIILEEARMMKSKCRDVMAGLAAAALAGSALAAPTVLRASHQFPGGRGDVRDEMVQIIARDAKAAGVDLEVQVYPGASLFKPNEQWNALVNGQLDISSFPLDYASGKVRAFGATLMPGLVRSHDRAQRLNDSPFMKDIKAQIDKAGVVVLADAWLAGAIASKRGCIRKPDDIKGLKVRSAGPTFAAMWQAAGASIVSIPSNEVYNALQTGVAEATDTSSGSFVSFRIYEQVKCLTAPGDNALWFMYEPVLMSKRSFDRLNKQQQEVLLKAGSKSQDFFNQATKKLDDEMVDTFKKNNVEVVSMSQPEYDAWLKIAQESSYKEFANEVPDGKKLIDAALAVK